MIQKIEKTIEKAEKGKDVTNSSTVYNSHLDLISVQSKVVSDLKSIHWDASRRQNFDSENKLAQGTDLNQEYKQRYCDAEERNRKLEEENQALRKEKQELKAENQALRKEKQELKAENQELREEKQELKAGNQELKQEFEVFTREVTTLMQNVTVEGVKSRDARENNKISH